MKPTWSLLVLLLVACPDAQPCVQCPPVEGVWFLQYLVPDFPCDGGALPAPAPTVQFTREGSVLRGAIDGVALSGSVYDTFDFTLNGQKPGGGLSISLRGKYNPASRADAGDETIYDGRLLRSTSQCSDDRRFTGARY